MKHFIAALVFLLLAASSASAQQPSPRFARAFGGISFLSEPGGLAGGTLGVRLSPALEALVEVGGFTNMLPQQIQQDLDNAARAAGTIYGAPLTIDATAPAVYVLGGIRAIKTTAQRLILFVESGAGMAHGVSHVSAEAGGADVSREVTTALHIKRSDQRATVFVGAGVGVPLTARMSLELGYRYMRVFTDPPRINTAAMTAGLNWGF